MKRIITEQHYLNKYKGQNKDLTKVDRQKEQLKKVVMDFVKPNYVAVYRPKVSTLNYKNVDTLMQNTIANYELSYPTDMKFIYYTVEADRYKKSYHLNLCIRGENIKKHYLANAMKRSEAEIGYFEEIKNLPALAIYVNKHMGKKGINTALNGLVESQQAVEEKLFRNEVGYMNFDNHPNKQHHLNAQIVSKLMYGWMQTTAY
jgi:hypothetical protein|tara:strand:+ start:881 stop:1489 length:609 start_codon:yes stop_codon:yes gene_type:complete